MLAIPGELISDGVRAASAAPALGRPLVGDSNVPKKGNVTVSAAARTLGSTATKAVPYSPPNYCPA